MKKYIFIAVDLNFFKDFTDSFLYLSRFIIKRTLFLCPLSSAEY